MSKMNPYKTKGKSRKRFFIPGTITLEDGSYAPTICIVNADYFKEQILNRFDALCLAHVIYSELIKTLKDEAESECSLTLERLKVSTGLRRSLDELEKKWPFINYELRKNFTKIESANIASC